MLFAAFAGAGASPRTTHDNTTTIVRKPTARKLRFRRGAVTFFPSADSSTEDRPVAGVVQTLTVGLAISPMV